MTKMPHINDDNQLLYHALGIFPARLWIPETVVVRLWCVLDRNLTANNCADIALHFFHESLVERHKEGDAFFLHDYSHETNRNHLKDENQYQLMQQTLLDAYEVSDWLDLPKDDLYIWQYLGYHLLEAGRIDELHSLLTASPAWMNAKERLFYSDNAYIADLELAMEAYDDPLTPEEMIRLVQLNTARQVVKGRINVYTDKMLEALVHLGREREAIHHARLRKGITKCFDGLFIIWKVSHSGRITVDDLMQSIEAIRWPPDQVYPLCVLALALDQRNDVRADVIFKQARQVALSIKNHSKIDDERHVRELLAKVLIDAGRLDGAHEIANSMRGGSHVLSQLTGAFARAGRMREAQQIADTLTYESQVNALCQIAVVLTQANDPTADEIFQQARDLTNEINYSSWKNSASSSLAMAFAQVHRIDEAKKIADTLEHQLSKVHVVEGIIKSLIQLQRFDEARQVADTTQVGRVPLVTALVQADRLDEAREIAISTLDAYGQAMALMALLKPIIQTDAAHADAIIEQITAAVATFPHDHRKVDALTDLASVLAQTNHPMADAIFQQARQLAQPRLGFFSTNDYHKAVALRLIARGLIQVAAPHTDSAIRLAHQAAESVHTFGSTRKATALRDLAKLLTEAGDTRADDIFKRAHEVTIDGQNKHSESIELFHLVTAFAQLKQFDKAHELVGSIQYAEWKAKARSVIVLALAQASRFDEAIEVADNIQDEVAQASALTELAKSLVKVNDSRATAIFTQAHDVANTIKHAYPQSVALSQLAIGLVQADDVRADDIFKQADDMATPISHIPARDVALHELSIALAKVQRLDDAYKTARRIYDAHKKVDVLCQLATELAKVDASRAEPVFQLARKIANHIEADFLQHDAIMQIAIATAQTSKFKNAIVALGLTDMESYIWFLSEWQPTLSDSYPDEITLWQRMMLASLEIICWIRKDYEPVRDIFHQNINDS